MNILHMKYAVEVAKVGFLNNAAEVLFSAAEKLLKKHLVMLFQF